MAKKVTAMVKLQIPGGQANPSPPVGPALGQHGANIMEFCKAFNAATKDNVGLITPVEITIYSDRSFTFVTKTPPGCRSAQDRGGHREGLRRAQQEQGRQGQTRAACGRSPSKKLPDLNTTDSRPRFAPSRAPPAAWASTIVD